MSCFVYKPRSAPQTQIERPIDPQVDQAQAAQKIIRKKKAMKTVIAAGTHPTYRLMVAAAIKASVDRKGCTRQAILKHVLENYDVGNDSRKVNGFCRCALKAGLETGTFKLAKEDTAGRYRLYNPKMDLGPAAAKNDEAPKKNVVGRKKSVAKTKAKTAPVAAAKKAAPTKKKPTAARRKQNVTKKKVTQKPVTPKKTVAVAQKSPTNPHAPPKGRIPRKAAPKPRVMRTSRR